MSYAEICVARYRKVTDLVARRRRTRRNELSKVDALSSWLALFQRFCLETDNSCSVFSSHSEVSY